MKYIQYRFQKFLYSDSRFQEEDKFYKRKVDLTLSRVFFVFKRIFLIIFPFIVATSLWTTATICIFALFAVVTNHKSNIINLILHDQSFVGFSYFPLSYLGFVVIIWFSKDLWQYADKLYSSQIQQLYFLIPIVTALVFLSIDKVWSK